MKRIIPAIIIIVMLSLLFFLTAKVNELSSPLMPTGFAMSPTGYMKNSHAVQQVEISSVKYVFTYRFMDNRSVTRTWRWSIDKNLVDSMINKYGVNMSLFEGRRFTASSQEELNRMMNEYYASQNRELQNGLFMKAGGNTILPDYSAVTNFYMRLVRGIYRLIDRQATQMGYSIRDKIELTMRFAQDIPYGIPPENARGKFIGGMLVPPETLINKWGDCDTKCVLFTSILCHDPNFRNAKIATISVPGHMFLGIQMQPNPYDSQITVRGTRYVICEPVGIARAPLGKPMRSYSTIKYFFPVNINSNNTGAENDGNEIAIELDGRGNPVGGTVAQQPAQSGQQPVQQETTRQPVQQQVTQQPVQQQVTQQPVQQQVTRQPVQQRVTQQPTRRRQSSAEGWGRRNQQRSRYQESGK